MPILVESNLEYQPPISGSPKEERKNHKELIQDEITDAITAHLALNRVYKLGQKGFNAVITNELIEYLEKYFKDNGFLEPKIDIITIMKT